MRAARRCAEKPVVSIAGRGLKVTKAYVSVEDDFAETASTWLPPAACLPLCRGATRRADAEAISGALPLAPDGGGVAGAGGRRRRRYGHRGAAARCSRRLRRHAEAARNPQTVWSAGGEDCGGLHGFIRRAEAGVGGTEERLSARSATCRCRDAAGVSF